MTRRLVLAAAFFAALTQPAFALAATESVVVPSGLSAALGIFGLVCAIGLMVAVLALRRVAVGGAIGDNMPFVVGAVLCLAASVLASWVGSLLPAELAPERARLGGDALVIASMLLFSTYFLRVRGAMFGLLKSMRAEQSSASEYTGRDRDAASA